MQKQQYLRKRQGNGGSPVEENLNDSMGSGRGSKITGDNIQARMQDRTTVRIRTKNN